MLRHAVGMCPCLGGALQFYFDGGTRFGFAACLSFGGKPGSSSPLRLFCSMVARCSDFCSQPVEFGLRFSETGCLLISRQPGFGCGRGSGIGGTA